VLSNKFKPSERPDSIFLHRFQPAAVCYLVDFCRIVRKQVLLGVLCCLQSLRPSCLLLLLLCRLLRRLVLRSKLCLRFKFGFRVSVSEFFDVHNGFRVCEYVLSRNGAIKSGNKTNCLSLDVACLTTPSHYRSTYKEGAPSETSGRQILAGNHIAKFI